NDRQRVSEGLLSAVSLASDGEFLSRHPSGFPGSVCGVPIEAKLDRRTSLLSRAVRIVIFHRRPSGIRLHQLRHAALEQNSGAGKAPVRLCSWGVYVGCVWV